MTDIKTPTVEEVKEALIRVEACCVDGHTHGEDMPALMVLARAVRAQTEVTIWSECTACDQAWEYEAARCPRCDRKTEATSRNLYAGLDKPKPGAGPSE